MSWTPERVRRFWDYQSRFPANYFAHQYGRAIAATLASHVSPPARVLDYACGPGFLIPALLERGYSVVAADQSSESVERANRTFGGRHRFEGARLTNAVRASERFDVAIMSELVEHLPDDPLDSVVREIRTLLRAGGYLLVTTPNEEDLQASMTYCPECQHTFHRWQHVRSWSAASLGDYLRTRGFEITVLKRTDFGAVFRGVLPRVVSRLRYALGVRKHPHLVVLARAV